MAPNICDDFIHTKLTARLLHFLQFLDCLFNKRSKLGERHVANPFGRHFTHPPPLLVYRYVLAQFEQVLVLPLPFLGGANRVAGKLCDKLIRFGGSEWSLSHRTRAHRSIQPTYFTARGSGFVWQIVSKPKPNGERSPPETEVSVVKSRIPRGEMQAQSSGCLG